MGESPLTLRISDLAHHLRQSKRTIRRWISGGLFPGPDLVLSAKVKLWTRATLEQWIEQQQAATAQGEAR